MKKYELTNETKTLAAGTVLHRIRALRDITRFGVKAGELGGFVEEENNLSQDGDAWVSGDAKVFGDAWVCGNAKIYGKAWVFGKARVSGNAEISCDAWVFGDAWVSDKAEIYGKAKVFGDAWVYGNAKIYGNACVFDNARVSGKADISGDAWVYGNACVFDNACVSSDAKISGDACVSDNAEIYGDAEVSANSDYMVVKNTWSSGRWFTYTRSNKKWVVGCFYGTGDELIKKAYADSELSGRCYEAIVRAVETIEAAKAEAKGESNGSK